MKKLIQFTSALLLTFSLGLSTAYAQAPEKMSYQAVVRDAGNNLTTNQGVGIQISILQGSTTGTAVYVETQSLTTNANGLVSLEIGTGTVVSGDFTTIDWANDTYFIQIETDPTAAGGTNYTITGTTQLMSVPYALHAKTADNFTGTITEADPVFGASIANGITAVDTANWNNHTVDTDTQLDSTGIAALGYAAGLHTDSTAIANMGFVAGASTGGHYVGELFGGGIVFYVYNNGSNGLIASLDDLDGGSGVAWSGTTNSLIGTTAQSMTDGNSNTTVIVAQDATPSMAATLCNSYAGGGFTDWYLPSNRELYLLASQDILIDQILDNDANSATNGFSQEYVAPTYETYWSSTEYNDNFAWAYYFKNGNSNYTSKNNLYRVRAVRAF